LTYKIVCLDVHDPKVRNVMQSVVPEGFHLEMADSYEPGEQMKLAADADFIMAGWAPVPEEMIRSAKKVKLIQKWGIGYDKISIDTARQLDIPVAITAGCNAIPVAELAVGLMLSVYRKIPFVDRQLRAGRWLKTEMRARCFMLYDKTIGIIGCGNIGSRVAKLLRGFECKVIYYDIVKRSSENEAELNVEFRPFEELIQSSDIVSLHVPLKSDTSGYINRDVFPKMKPSAILINTARGGIVNEKDLIWALQEGIIAGAGIDVFAMEPPDPQNPLLRMDNVAATTHIGGGVLDNVAYVTRHGFDNMKKILADEPLHEQDIVVSKR
jgi:phosphoglycerate dehydrogenase-like enzyme